MERGSIRWSMIVVVVPAFIVFGVLLPLIAFWTRYPNPVAVHWEISGQPNGEMPLLGYTAFLTFGLILSWIALVAGAREGMPSAPLTAVTYFIMGLLAAVNAHIVIANLDAPSWEAADDMSLALFVAVLLAGTLAGAIGWFAAGGVHGVPIDEPLAAASAPSGTWSGGWGYRVRPRVRAFIIRSGPAIRIERSKRPDTLVTVDDAPVGAASIGALARH